MRGHGSYRGSRRGGFAPERKVAPDAGPLMTHHLRDIDIEMEILKRKREMIQQEQALLEREREFTLKRQYESDRSNSYSQPPKAGYSSNYYQQQGSKRQAVSKPQLQLGPTPRVEPWQYNLNVAEPSRSVQRSRNHQSIPKPNTKPQPLLSINIDKSFHSQNLKLKKYSPAQKHSEAARKDFNPTKVTKSKSRSPYLNKQKVDDAPQKVSDEAMILRADVTPSPQVNGRLELALGTILKDIKKLSENQQPADVAYTVSRMMKKIIRQRLHTIMLGKVVDHVPNIVKLYRQQYPRNTDIDLIKISKQTQSLNWKSLSLVSGETEDPLQFFKENINKLLHQKLNDIFGNITNIYAHKNNAEVIKKNIEHVIDISTTTSNTDAPVPMEVDGDGKSNDKNNVTDDVASQNSKAEAYCKLMDALIEERLPNLLVKHKQTLVNILNSDMEYNNLKSKIEDETIKLACKVIVDDMKRGDAEKNDSDGCVIIKDNTKVIDLTEDRQVNVNDQEIAQIDEKTVVGSTPVIDETSTTQEATPVKYNIENTEQYSALKTPQKTIDYPYFVKLIGRPELPSRQVVYEFLDQFKPASIKKHKTVVNLLVLGFNDKDNYEKILQANETSIGTNTLYIKASEKVSSTPQNPNSSAGNLQPRDETSVNKDVPNNKTENCSFSNEQELDNQIKTLLTSIRQSEEQTQNKHDETNKNEQGCDENVCEKPSEESLNDDVTGDDKAKDTEPLDTITEVEEVVTNDTDNNENKNEDTPKESDAEANTINKEIKTEASSKNEEVLNKEENESETVSNADGSDNKHQNVNINIKTEQNEQMSDCTEEMEKENEKVIEKDTKNAIKDETPGTGRATPTRSSARLASTTPSTIRTRRASRLAQKN